MRGRKAFGGRRRGLFGGSRDGGSEIGCGRTRTRARERREGEAGRVFEDRGARD